MILLRLLKIGDWCHVFLPPWRPVLFIFFIAPHKWGGGIPDPSPTAPLPAEVPAARPPKPTHLPTHPQAPNPTTQVVTGFYNLRMCQRNFRRNISDISNKVIILRYICWGPPDRAPPSGAPHPRDSSG